MARYSWTRKITDLLASSRGKRRLQSWHLDLNFGALDNRVEALTGALFVSGGVSRAGTLSVAGSTLTLTSDHVGVTLDGYTALVQASGSSVSTAGMAGKLRLVVAPTPVTEAHTWPEPLSPGEVITDLMVVRLGNLVALTGGTLDSAGYPVVPSTCVPLAKLTCNAGVATVDGIDSAPPTPNAGLRGTAGLSISGAAVNSAGHLILTYSDNSQQDAGSVRGSSALSSLTDVDLSGVTDGQVLAYDLASGHWRPHTPASGGGGSASLGGLTDVAIAAPAAGQVLGYDGQHWVNQAAPSGGGTPHLSTAAQVAVDFNPAQLQDAGAAGGISGQHIIVSTNTPVTNITFSLAANGRSDERLAIARLAQDGSGNIVEIVRSINTANNPAAGSYDFQFAQYTLLGGWEYVIGIDAQGNSADARNTQINTSQPGAKTQGAITLQGWWRGDNDSNCLPALGQYQHRIKISAASAAKSVVGPLDPIDSPVVTSAGSLEPGSAAILDDGVAAPRLIRKRADGSVWYGTPFSNQP